MAKCVPSERAAEAARQFCNQNMSNMRLAYAMGETSPDSFMRIRMRDFMGLCKTLHLAGYSPEGVAEIEDSENPDVKRNHSDAV